MKNNIGWWISLNKIEGLGNVRIKKLLNYFETIENITEADERTLKEVEGISANIARNILTIKDADIKKELDNLKQKGVNAITIDDQDYPFLLKETYDPPSVIYYRGKYDISFFEKCVAIVGTRGATVYGKEIAKSMACDLSKDGVTIVSGMASGIDTAAHTGALESDGQTIAVVACGPDIIYPSSNRNLYQNLISKGLVLSEYPPGTMPESGRFPARNRIISGLSRGVLIVEAPEKSGALITSDFALEQGRDVFVVPGNINNPKNKGCHNLIKQGAILITEAKDILNEFGWIEGSLQENKDRNIPQLNDKETKVYSTLGYEPVHIDTILLKSGLNSSELMEVLTMLEIKGIISEIPGKLFTIKA